MRRSIPLAVALLALALGAAEATPPKAGLFVPGRSLGGLRLGMTPAQVKAAWGTKFGRCRSCPRATWYYTYRPFAPKGAGVQFRNGRAVAVFTLWAPSRWRTRDGLRIGDRAERIAELYGALLRAECGTYYARMLASGGGAVSVFYVVGEQVWGFALIRPPVRPCL